MKNLMRNEQLLQNYRPSFAKLCLTSNRETIYGELISDNMRTKQYWLNIFNSAIDDLSKGYRINGKGLKNTTDYWKSQIEMIESL